MWLFSLCPVTSYHTVCMLSINLLSSQSPLCYLHVSDIVWLYCDYSILVLNIFWKMPYQGTMLPWYPALWPIKHAIILFDCGLIVLCLRCCLWLMTTWWRHQMETFSALLAICAGNSPVTGELPAQRPATRSFDVFFDLRLNIRLSKQWWGWWFETPSRPLWRHCNASEHTLASNFIHATVNILRPKQNGRHFPDIFKCIRFSENVWISLKIVMLVAQMA